MTLLIIGVALDRIEAGDAPDHLNLEAGRIRFSTIPAGWSTCWDSPDTVGRHLVQDKNGFRLILKIRDEPTELGWHGAASSQGVMGPWQVPIEQVRQCYRQKNDVHFEESRRIKGLHVVMEAWGSGTKPITVDEFISQLKDWYPSYLGLCERVAELSR